MSVLQVIEQREILGKQLTMYGDFENPLFLAKEVAEWIDYDLSSINKMLNSVDEDEKVRNIVPTLGGNQEAWFLTEDGLYEVLMQSRKPIAKQFKKEVKTLLKNIRKGRYIGLQEISNCGIKEIVKETICQVVPEIIRELEDKEERNKRAERELKKLEAKVKRRIERLLYSEKYSYYEISKLLGQEEIDVSAEAINRQKNVTSACFTKDYFYFFHPIIA